MDGLDYWRRWPDEYSVVQAALIIAQLDPSQQHNVEHNLPMNRPPGYEAAKAALVNSIVAKELPAKHIEIDDRGQIVGSPNWHIVKVTKRDLSAWGPLHGIHAFSSDLPGSAQKAEPDYLCKSHLHYSPKLAAAVSAWTAVSGDDQLRRGKTVKQAAIEWLQENAKDFGLTKGDGSLNNQGIKEVAKIINWDPEGGAPPTPS